MQIYIDESGNLGKKGRFFVIACLIPQNPKRVKNIIKRCCVDFSPGLNVLKELKGACLSFSEKQKVLTKLNKKDDFSCAYIVADKKYLIPKILQDKNLCYNYLSSHLLKRILKGATEDVQIILDNHTIKVASLNSLKDYIRIEAYTKWGFRYNLTFEYQDSQKYKNLQAVDIIANTIYGRFNYNKLHLYNLLYTKFTYCLAFPYKKFNT